MLQEDFELQEIELHLWMVSLMPQEVIDFLKTQFGGNYEILSSNEQIALATTCLENEVTNRRLQAILEMHPADIGEMLGEMADKKRLLKKNYKGRWTTYTLNTSSDDELPLFAFSRQQNQDKQGEVTAKQGEVNEGTQGLSTSQPDGLTSQPEFKDIPASLLERLKVFPKRTKGDAQLLAIIVEICSWKPQTNESLGKMLHRSPEYIRKFVSKYIGKELDYLYPSIIHHPNQAYVAQNK